MAWSGISKSGKAIGWDTYLGGKERVYKTLKLDNIKTRQELEKKLTDYPAIKKGLFDQGKLWEYVKVKNDLFKELLPLDKIKLDKIKDSETRRSNNILSGKLKHVGVAIKDAFMAGMTNRKNISKYVEKVTGRKASTVNRDMTSLHKCHVIGQVERGKWLWM